MTTEDLRSNRIQVVLTVMFIPDKTITKLSFHIYHCKEAIEINNIAKCTQNSNLYTVSVACTQYNSEFI